MYKQFYERFYPRWIPTRVLICVMTFTACWTSYMCRLQMPILVVPMIRTLPGNRSAGACVLQDGADRQVRGISMIDPGAYLEDYVLDKQMSSLEDQDGPAVDPRVLSKNVRPYDSPVELFNGLPFDWSADIRGQLIAGYAYGNVPGNFIGGVMAMRLGPRRAIMWTSVLAAVLSLISPILAQWHWGVLFVTRVIIGVTGGITFPACHTMVAKWAPPQEKSRFIWALLGGTFGTIFTYPMVAAIAENLNWECGWYIPSLLMMVWIVVWAMLAYDSPAEHPGITDEERDYIMSAQAGSVRTEKPTMKQTPFKKIFTSVPFISLLICHFGNLFLLFFYQSAMMLYMTKALGFQLTKGGAAAGLPWAGRMIFGFFFSWTGDMIRAKQIISLTTLRKTAMIFSHFLPGVFLIAVGYVGCSLVLANVFLFLALGFNGAASIANLSNNQDLAPNFAGLLYGIMNTIGSTSGIIIPPMVEEIAGKYGMMHDCLLSLLLYSLILISGTLSASLIDHARKIDQTMRPKPKRAQEMLMFGNQQNRQAEGATNSYTSTAEKRTLSSSGLGGLKAALAEEEKPSHSKQPSNTLYDRDSYIPYDKNYEYGKVLVNELGDEMPQVWDVPPYTRYYMGEDRRKRSEKPTVTTGSTTVRPSTASFQVPTPTQQSVQAQVKRSVPIYQEPRFKRELDINPEDVLTLLSLWENERRNRNWRKYMNEEYENMDEDGTILDEEDPRNVIPWMDGAVYPPRHYGVDALSPADIGIVRTHPPSYYEQFGNQYGQQYETGSQYGLVYPQRSYYNTPEKRFMVSRKRTQSYDPYSSSAQLQIGTSRGFPYQHRLVY